jgi:hypothetical protein
MLLDQVKMNSSVNLPGRANWKHALGLPMMVLLACFLISRSALFIPGRDILSNAILADILITAPLLYFLAIRKTNVSKWTVARVFIICLLAAGIILNKADNGLLYFIKIWISPLIEFSLIIFISRKFYLANLHAKSAGLNSIDFLTHCRFMMKEVTGSEKAGNILSSEIAVFYYALGGRKCRSIDHLQTFSNYRENGIILVLGTFLCLFMIETIGVHFLIALWKPVVAWVFTILSLYTCLQLFAHIRAIRSRPTMIGLSALDLHNGLAADVTIEFSDIEEVILTKKQPDGGEQVRLALLNGLEPYNVLIRLKKTIIVTKIFGIQKKADVILFHIDRPVEFVQSLEGAIASDPINIT